MDALGSIIELRFVLECLVVRVWYSGGCCPIFVESTSFASLLKINTKSHPGVMS